MSLFSLQLVSAALSTPKKKEIKSVVQDQMPNIVGKNLNCIYQGLLALQKSCHKMLTQTAQKKVGNQQFLSFSSHKCSGIFPHQGFWIILKLGFKNELAMVQILAIQRISVYRFDITKVMSADATSCLTNRLGN